MRLQTAVDPLIIPSGGYERVTEAEQEVGDLMGFGGGFPRDWLLGWLGCSIGGAANFENESPSELM